jgi:hypothetical protein
MSRIISENEQAWSKKSWINDLAQNVKLANSLTEEYATDVLESVAEGYHTSLDEAIADLSKRIGLKASESLEIKTAAVKMVMPDKKACCCECKEQEIVGNKDVPGAMLVKVSPEAATESVQTIAKTNGEVKIAGELPEGLKNYLEKKNEGKEDKGDKKEETEASFNKEELFRLAKNDSKAFGIKLAELQNNPQAVEYAKKIMAYFQGADEKPIAGNEKTVSNNPEILGFNEAGKGEVKYDKKSMEVSAPGGEDSRPFEQQKFEGEAKETKKNLGPSGDELKLKQKMQRAKRIELLKSYALKKK